jgi:hypothetical protein
MCPTVARDVATDRPYGPAQFHSLWCSCFRFSRTYPFEAGFKKRHFVGHGCRSRFEFTLSFLSMKVFLPQHPPLSPLLPPPPDVQHNTKTRRQNRDKQHRDNTACLGFVLVLSWCCLGVVLVLSWCCLGVVLSWWWSWWSWWVFLLTNIYR